MPKKPSKCIVNLIAGERECQTNNLVVNCPLPEVNLGIKNGPGIEFLDVTQVYSIPLSSSIIFVDELF